MLTMRVNAQIPSPLSTEERTALATTKEWVEQLGQVLLLDAHAVVLYLQVDPALSKPGAHADAVLLSGPPVGHGLGGI